MTDNKVGAGGPLGPPWSVDVLSDLHAGLLPEAEATRLWPRVNADPQARAVLEALDSVRADLTDLSAAPVEPMPAQYAARLDAVIQNEMRSGSWLPAPDQRQAAPVIGIDSARKRRNRRLSWGVGIFAAAAAALAVTVAVLPSNTTSGNPQAQISSDAGDSDRPPLALDGSNPTAPIKEFTEGEPDYGPFGDEDALLECLDKHDIKAGDPIGAREVTLDDKDGVAALLGAGEGTPPGRFLLVIVSPDCSKVMGQSTIGR
jgi:hypothetical protein